MIDLSSLYIGCTVFGAGVTVIDMFGILGDIFHHGGGSDSGSHSDHVGAHGSHGGFHGDHGHAGDSHGAHGGDHGAHPGEQTHENDSAITHGEKGSVSAHDPAAVRAEYNVLGNVLSVARSLVHFSLGFGPVGWFAVATGRGGVESLIWSIPVGVVAMAGGRFLRRLQRQQLDSQFTTEDMIMERGEVLVSIGKGQLGQVRILVDGAYAERFARASDPAKSLPAGTPIRVVDVTDECVYVEQE